jgi:ABC-type transport system involved in multi-copper enzyme maturation permease subunit
MIFSTIILAAMMIMLGVMYPGDENLAEYFDLITQSGMEGILGVIGGDAPGWVLWISMQLGPYLYYVFVIVAIKIGARLIPTKDDDSLELLLGSSPKSARIFYLENILSSVIVLSIIAIPSYLIILIFSLIEGSLDIMGRVSIVYLFILGIAIVYISMVSMIGILRFSKSSALKFGFGYLIFSFLMELTSPSLDEQRQKMVNLSFNYYLHPSSGLINGEFNWLGLGILLSLALVFFIIGYWKVTVPDYNERSSVVKEKKSKLSFLPEFSPDGKLSKKYPLIFDQFRRDRGFVFIWTIIIVFMLVYITMMYKTMTEEQISTIFASFDSPQAGAIIQNHDLPISFTGFFSYQVLGMTWLWFGIFILIISVNVANRDVSDDTQDILWANNLTQERVVNSRTMAMLIEFTLMYWIVSFSIILTAVAYVGEVDGWLLFAVFFVGWIHYMAMGVFLVGITMLVRIDKGRKTGYWVFVIMVMVFLTAFSSPDAEMMKFISFLSYYDPIGILLEINSVFAALLTSGLIILASMIFYLIVLRYRYKNLDLM